MLEGWPNRACTSISLRPTRLGVAASGGLTGAVDTDPGAFRATCCSCAGVVPALVGAGRAAVAAASLAGAGAVLDVVSRLKSLRALFIASHPPSVARRSSGPAWALAHDRMARDGKGPDIRLFVISPRIRANFGKILPR